MINFLCIVIAYKKLDIKSGVMINDRSPVITVRQYRSVPIYIIDVVCMTRNLLPDVITPGFTTTKEEHWDVTLSSDSSVIVICNNVHDSNRSQVQVFAMYPAKD